MPGAWAELDAYGTGVKRKVIMPSHRCGHVRRQECPVVGHDPVRAGIESPRDCRRLQHLRGWGHVKGNEVFGRGQGAGSPAGEGAHRRVSLSSGLPLSPARRRSAVPVKLPGSGAGRPSEIGERDQGCRARSSRAPPSERDPPQSICIFRSGEGRLGARSPTQVMVSFIDLLRGAYGVEPICEVLPIFPSTYYAHKARAVDPALRT
jgi:hypothetical protein